MRKKAASCERAPGASLSFLWRPAGPPTRPTDPGLAAFREKTTPRTPSGGEWGGGRGGRVRQVGGSIGTEREGRASSRAPPLFFNAISLLALHQHAPVAGADLRAALVASCLRGALPPVDLRAVCFVRAIVGGGVRVGGWGGRKTEV